MSRLAPDVATHRASPSPSSHARPPSVPLFLHVQLHLPILPYRRPGSTAASDIALSLSAHGNLAALRRTHYPRIERRAADLALWLLALSLALPNHILPPPPPAPQLLLTSPQSLHGAEAAAHAAASHAHARALAAWFSRLLALPDVLRHPATPALIDADFAYVPVLPNVGPGAAPAAQRRLDAAISAVRSAGNLSVDVGAGLGLPSGAVTTSLALRAAQPSNAGLFGSLRAARQVNGASSATAISGADTDEELVAARAEVTRLEMQFRAAAERGERREESGAVLTGALAALSARLEALATLEATRAIPAREGLPDVLQQTASALRALAFERDTLSAHSHLHLAHPLSYQSLAARAARDALLVRHGLVDAAHEAAGTAMLKRREAENLRARSAAGGNFERVEAKLEELQEARQQAAHLASQLASLSTSLRASLATHARATHKDLHEALRIHARGARAANGAMLAHMVRLQAAVRGESEVELPPELEAEAGQQNVLLPQEETREVYGETSAPIVGATQDQTQDQAEAPQRRSSEAAAPQTAPPAAQDSQTREYLQQAVETQARPSTPPPAVASGPAPTPDARSDTPRAAAAPSAPPLASPAVARPAPSPSPTPSTPVPSPAPKATFQPRGASYYSSGGGGNGNGNVPPLSFVPAAQAPTRTMPTAGLPRTPASAGFAQQQHQQQPQQPPHQQQQYQPALASPAAQGSPQRPYADGSQSPASRLASQRAPLDASVPPLSASVPSLPPSSASAGAPPSPFGMPNSGLAASGTLPRLGGAGTLNSGASAWGASSTRLSAADAARSLAGRF